MTAFPMQKTLAAVIAIAKTPEKRHSLYGADARDLAKAIGIDPDSLLKIGYGTTVIRTTHEAVVSPLEHPTKLAEKSYAGISHSGATRARMDRDSYVETVQKLYDEAITQAKSEAQRAAVLEATDKFKREYLDREKRLISVRTGAYSGHVAGRSKLNTRESNAGNDRLSMAIDDFYSWVKKASPSIMQAVMDAKSPEQKSAEKQAAEDKLAASRQKNDDFLRKLLNFRKGDDFKVGQYTLVRVNKDKDGIPLSLTMTGEGIIKGVNDKIDLIGARMTYKSRNEMREAMDRVLASKNQSVVYYHGSDTDAPMTGNFTYLTQDPEIAKTYGSKVHAVTVDVRKTLDMTDMKTAQMVFDKVIPDIDEEDLYPLGVMIAVRYAEDEIREWAQAQGYDSLLLPTTLSMGSMVLADKPALVVFDPSKIKKADVQGFDNIDVDAHQAATSPQNNLPEPTDGQKLAGSYKMGRIRISGLDIAIENPEGSVRSGIGADGKRWSNTMQHHYGYINGSTGADGDHIDVFVQPGLSEDYDGPVYVIDQIDPETGDFDEHKVIIGATSTQQAKAMYLSNYDKGWQGCGDVTALTWKEFREWIDSGDTTGPIGEAIEVGYDAASATGWIGVDLDGTLAKYKGWNGNAHIGSPVVKMVRRVKAWLKDGKDVRIFTARAADSDAIPHVEAWCEKVFGKKLPVTNKKDSDMIQLWDDRAVAVETNTGLVLSAYDDMSIISGRRPLSMSLSALLDEITRFDGSTMRAASLSHMLGIAIKSPALDESRDYLAAEPVSELDLFGDPIQPLEGMAEDLFGDEPIPQHMPIEEIPLSIIGLSADVPQFKSGADDDTGVVEPLGGKFDRTGVAPIQLWKRRDGRMEVISGRHRLDLARRSGEKTIPAQVHHEDRGFDARRAAMLDAELNIRDGQGKVRDYVDYFTHSGIEEADAEAKGLLARSIGQRAFGIATQGTEDLIAAHKAEIISDQAAADIAGLAPGNAAMQAVGIRAIQEGKPIQTAVNTMRAVMALARENGQAADTMDLFGFDDSAMKEAEAMAKLASRKQRQISEQLAAIKGAAKRPELARKQGVSVEDPESVRSRVIELTALKQRWDNWSSHSDLLAEIRQDIQDKGGYDSIIEDYDSLAMPSLTDYSVQDIDTDDINVNPTAYQWRLNVNGDGTEKGRAVAGVFDYDTQPPLILHRRLSGRIYLVDGHHRYKMAKASHAPIVKAIVLDEHDGYTVPAMRVLCGFLNLRKEALVKDRVKLPMVNMARTADLVRMAVETEMGWV